jgi:acyl-CoA thioester hydrolase
MFVEYITMQNFKHKTSIQIRFKDIDLMGHVNNADFLTYIELARVKYFDDVVGEKVNWSKQGIILAKITIDYKMPIYFKDKIFIYTKCSRIGNKSFDLSYSVVKEENGREILTAEATTVLVCYDYERRTSIAIPDEWKKKLQKSEI